ncbi:MAG: NitT/TauT family transport system substrate-binding protein [Candidatus Binatota bacterium]|nr:NitT/TauT family transport system substrate-binding protein [Candidatus Binatota bacterium]
MNRSHGGRPIKAGNAVLTHVRKLLFAFTLSATQAISWGYAQTSAPVLVAYAGQNETVGPMWVGIEKGTFRKYGLDVRLVQMRNGALSMATLSSGQVQYNYGSPGNALSAAVGGMKIQCVASPVQKIPRELVARKEIRTLEDLRGKTFGVQSIGGGFWLQTMIALDQLGIDPEKYDLKMRILGDTATVTQALGSGGVDATVIPYSFSEAAKRAGANVLADIGKLNFPYQGTTLCFFRDSAASAPDQVSRLLKGLVDAVVLIHDPGAKPDVVEILRKAFRFPKAEDAEASYKVLTIMATIDMLPDPAAWKLVQKVTAKINPKVAQVELSQLLNPAAVRSLEDSGFLAEARKKLRP